MMSNVSPLLKSDTRVMVTIICVWVHSRDLGVVFCGREKWMSGRWNSFLTGLRVCVGLVPHMTADVDSISSLDPGSNLWYYTTHKEILWGTSLFWIMEFYGAIRPWTERCQSIRWPQRWVTHCWHLLSMTHQCHPSLIIYNSPKISPDYCTTSTFHIK